MEEEEDVTSKLKKLKGKKIHPVRLTILIIMAVATICAFVLHDYISVDSPKCVFNRDISNFGLLNIIYRNIPLIIKSIQIITVVLVVATLFMLVIEKCMGKTARGITVSRLINNFIKWIVAIALVIVILAVWGVNATALITGAGVLTLVVGLGMQSLIADVVAGLFIVFENEFNVGDIITVGDFRGTVVSIGIRTTKLEALGNLKIINNNEIKGVLNQTYKLSTAFAYVETRYEDKLPEIEKIIAKHIDELEIEGAVGKVSYDGVDEFGSSGVRLQFSVQAKEGDVLAVRRGLNGAIKVMFDKYGVDIPYTQIVLHNAEEK